jgi:hypothetical protein
MVFIDAQTLCQLILPGDNVYVYSVVGVVKIDNFFRILFTKKTQLIIAVACLFPSSSAATRPPSPLELAILNTTHYTSRLGMYETLLDVHIVMLLFLSAFLLFQKVRDYHQFINGIIHELILEGVYELYHVSLGY